MERAFVEGGHPPARTVVACGGGLVVQPGLPALLAERGVTICLHASITTILERTGRQAGRPLLNVPDPEERVRALLAEREPIYRGVGTLVLTDARPLRDVVAHVVRIWQRESAEFARRHPAAPA
jgi:shikimate kinase